MYIYVISLTGSLICIGGWSCVCQPYIENATALSDYEYIVRNDGF